MPGILFISTHNFTTNPRLVKEIDLALRNNYEVSALCCSFNNWSKENNEKIKLRLISQINYYEIPGNRTPFIPWVLSSFWFSFSKIMLQFFPENLYFLSLNSNKRSWLLLQKNKEISEKVDLVISHNPGSFYPAMKFAQRNKIPFGIDLEDYHPGETTNEKSIRNLKNLLKKILPKAAYLSAASPLILQYTLNDIVPYEKQTEVIRNWFPSTEFQRPLEINKERLQIVWFSQNIAVGRGLEQIIPVIKKYESTIELHLYGNMQQPFFREWLKDIKNIIVHKALPQKELHKELSKYDIGLAIEPGKDLNNELAISNKILAYVQAGLFVLASNTVAQKEFLIQYINAGILTELDENSFTKNIEFLLKEKENLRLQKQKRFIGAQDYCWENESEKLLQTWKQTV